jgi:transposase
MRHRGEMLERSFAHVLETGRMRRTHLPFHYNIAKRMLIHVNGLNLGLLMGKRFGIGTPRGFQGRLVAAVAAFVALIDLVCDLLVPPGYPQREDQPARIEPAAWLTPELLAA